MNTMNTSGFSIYCISKEVYVKAVAVIETKWCNRTRCVDAV